MTFISNSPTTSDPPFMSNFPVRSTKLPYVTVSAKGMSNGLSDIPNDGADFGPDTMLGATSKDQYGPPYTQTSGIQEALDYSQSNANAGVLLNGDFYISVPIILRSTYVNVVMQGINGNSSKNGTQIYLASDFNITTYNYMILLQQQGNLIFDNIRLTPSLPNGTKIDYTINFAVNSTSNMIFSNATWDAAAIAQLYVSSQSNNGRYTFVNIQFNGITPYLIYTTYATAPWNFINCQMNSSIYAVIPNNTGSFSANFVACNGPYLHSADSNINLQNVHLNFVEDGPVLEGTAQIGDNVTINVTNGRISQYAGANWFNIQGTNFNMNVEDSYMDMNGGTSGSTYYFVTSTSTASGMVRINRNYQSLITVPGVSMQILEGLGSSPPPTVPVIITNTNPNSTGWIKDAYYVVPGTTAGTVSFYIAEYTPNYKKLIAIFEGYENDTATAQNIVYPWAPFFNGLQQNNGQNPAAIFNSTGLTIGNGPSPSSIIINAPNSTATYSGIVIIEGY